MFTGIVQGIAIVTQFDLRDQALRLELDLGSLATSIQRGASIAVAGVCLTAIEITGSRVQFDIIGETLKKTALSSLRIGDQVNIERSARLGDEIGGHLVSGHVSDVAKISAIQQPVNNYVVTITCDSRWIPYILPKGFIALDGCSLTIVDVGSDWFSIHLIPETLSRTTFGTKRIGDFVHLEIDPLTRAVVDTVKRIQTF